MTAPTTPTPTASPSTHSTRSRHLAARGQDGRILAQGDRWKVFCREYVLDLNGTRAAIAAGYSPNSAANMASRLLRQRRVQKFLQELTEERAKRLEVTADRVLGELAKLGFSNIADYLDSTMSINLPQATRDQLCAVQEIQQVKGGVKLKLADKLRALELLGKHLTLFVDRVEVSGVESLAASIGKRRKAVEEEKS